MPQYLSPTLPTPWPPRGPIDLKALVKNLSTDPPVGRATAGQFRHGHRLIENRPRPIEADPLQALGYLDGIQQRCLAGRFEHRDTTIAYVSAGLVSGKSLLSVEERLAVICGVEDEQRVRDALDGVPVVALPEVAPWHLALATDEWIDQTRRLLELHALQNAPGQPGRFVVVDGSLPTANHRTDAIGVIKSALDTDWLTPDLLPWRGGWRSPALLLPAVRADEHARLTAFVRLRDAPGTAWWGFSIVRVEVPETCGIEVLDAAAALAVSQRQSFGSRDPRAETHLAGFRLTEQVLRARSPFAIEVLH